MLATRQSLVGTSVSFGLLVAVLLVPTAVLQGEVLPNPDKPVPPVIHNTPITYNGELTNTPFTAGSGIQGSTGFRNINNPATWEYYSFCGRAGDRLTIEVHRTTAAMDPAMQICFGTATDSAGIFAFGGCGSMGPFTAAADDNNGIPHGVGGLFTDPRISVILPLTGEYTLMVFDFIGQGRDPEFEIHVSGVIPCEVEDTTPPEVACSLDIDSLWPPNHKLIDVGFDFIAVDDQDPDPTVEVLVFSDEPEEGDGDGNTEFDAVDDGDSLLLRAERSGTGDGRVYLIVIVATDEAGNVGFDCCTVVVPHDRSRRSVTSVETQAEIAEIECLLLGEAPTGFYSLIE